MGKVLPKLNFLHKQSLPFLINSVMTRVRFCEPRVGQVARYAKNHPRQLVQVFVHCLATVSIFFCLP